MQCSTLEGRGFIKATKPPASRLIQQTHCGTFFDRSGRGWSQSRPKTVDPRRRGIHHGQEVQDSQDHSDTHDPSQRHERGLLERIPDELTSEEERHQREEGHPSTSCGAPSVPPEDGEQREGHQTDGTEQARKPAQLVNLLPVPCQLVAGEKHADDGQNETQAAAQHWAPPFPRGDRHDTELPCTWLISPVKEQHNNNQIVNY